MPNWQPLTQLNCLAVYSHRHELERKGKFRTVRPHIILPAEKAIQSRRNLMSAGLPKSVPSECSTLTTQSAEETEYVSASVGKFSPAKISPEHLLSHHHPSTTQERSLETRESTSNSSSSSNTYPFPQQPFHSSSQLHRNLNPSIGNSFPRGHHDPSVVAAATSKTAADVPPSPPHVPKYPPLPDSLFPSRQAFSEMVQTVASCTAAATAAALAFQNNVSFLPPFSLKPYTFPLTILSPYMSLSLTLHPGSHCLSSDSKQEIAEGSFEEKLFLKMLFSFLS